MAVAEICLFQPGRLLNGPDFIIIRQPVCLQVPALLYGAGDMEDTERLGTVIQAVNLNR
jgi:hypothetical protein